MLSSGTCTRGHGSIFKVAICSIQFGAGRPQDVDACKFCCCRLQMTALLYRPLKTQPIRRYWNWAHWWLGRAATALAISNIY